VKPLNQVHTLYCWIPQVYESRPYLGTHLTLKLQLTLKPIKRNNVRLIQKEDLASQEVPIWKLSWFPIVPKLCVLKKKLFFAFFATMNGGLILCTKCGSKELLEINLLKWWTFFLSLPNCLHGFGGMDVPCAKRIVVLYEKSFISSSSLYQWCQNYILELVLKFSEEFSFSQLTST